MPRKVGFFHNGSKKSFEKHYAVLLARMNQSVAVKDVEVIDQWATDNKERSPDQQLGDLIGQGLAVLVAAAVLRPRWRPRKRPTASFPLCSPALRTRFGSASSKASTAPAGI